ncbi:MAG: glycosyltransferase family 39 protein [Acidobacteria bacterium]|nr:glycosyltransferase family 39 protein [Acidobacteriota bacterium]
MSLFRPGPAGLVVLAYCALLSALMARTPLWLDEILQLLGTTSADPRQAITWSAQNAGGVPLGYLIQWGFLHCLGNSPLVARLPSALAAVLSAWILLRICHEIALPRPSIALILFLILPLPLRYAVEARPYSLALLFTLVATEAALHLCRHPRALYFAIYLTSAIAALYTQPYSGFLLAAHAIWLLREKRSPTLHLVALLAVPAAAFVPWFLYARTLWAQSIQASGIHSHFEITTIRLILREICGGGYAVSIPLITLAVYGWVRGNLSSNHRWLLASSVMVPLVCVLAADAWFGYFFAIRQLVFILPALILLTAEGARLLLAQHRTLGTAVLATLLLSATAHNYRHIRTKGENWALAASVLQLATQSQACAMIAPQAHLSLYTLFAPTLRNRTCPNDLTSQSTVVAATSPYTTPSEALHLWQQLSEAGFQSSYRTEAGGTRIYVLRRQPAGTGSRWPAGRGPLAADPGPFTVHLRTFIAIQPILTSEANHVSQSIAVPHSTPGSPYAPSCRTVNGQRRHDPRVAPGPLSAGGPRRQRGNLQSDHWL